VSHYYYFYQLIKDKEPYEHIMQDSAATHIVGNCRNALTEGFGERVISQGLVRALARFKSYLFLLMRHPKKLLEEEVS
jgi:hypothetical protein